MSYEVTINLTIDGVPHSLDVDSERLLLHALRDDARKTAPKWGCGTGDCGACSVVLDDAVVDSCLVYAVECQDGQITTATALADTSVGRVVVEELERAGAVQCGICTPGFLVSIVTGIETLGPAPERAQITELLSGNLCRCTGYRPLYDAVEAAARRLHGGSTP